MQVTINHQQQQLTQPYPEHLQALLAIYAPELKSKGVAVALNNQVIPREDWPKTPILPEADILIITATQGG